MPNKIFINLPVTDLDKSKEFFTKLGFTINPQFTDETASCVLVSEEIYIMLLTHDKFKTFTKKELVDATQSTEVINALSVENKEGVEELFNKAIAAGAKEFRPADDYGFMISRSFEDLDGHIWEVLWMEPSYIEK